MDKREDGEKTRGAEARPIRRAQAAHARGPERSRPATQPPRGPVPHEERADEPAPRQAKTRAARKPHGNGNGNGNGTGRPEAAGSGKPSPRRGGGKPGRGPAADPRPLPQGARRGALRLLEAVRGGATLAEAAALLDDLTPADRARAQRLAAETLRRRGRSAAVLDALLTRTPRPEVLDILSLAVTEMLAMDEAPHGVVDTAVALTRAAGRRAAPAAGMANAVLRRAAEARADWQAAAPAPLPGWLRAPVAARWGEPAVLAIEAAHEAAPPLDLTGKPGAPMPGEALPTGSHRLPAGTQITTLPGYEAGDWWVQDAAAALPVRLLDPQPGERIADLCAAPGGKTMQLAAAGAEVTAIDLSPARLERVAENLARTGLRATLVAADALDWRPAAPLDAVLLDAPCSATGTIRRHPELPLIRDGAAIPALTDLQARLIDHALTLLKPGGRLVYAVCSLHPAEGEAQLAAALARYPALRVERPSVPGLDPAWVSPEGAIRTRPDCWADHGGLDGFFIVRLRRG